MAKRSKVKVPPTKPDLSRYVDFDEEAVKFELTTTKVAEIAHDVERKSPATFVTVTQTQKESELRERLQAIYNQQLDEWRECRWSGCEHRFGDIHDFVAHQRMHLICDGPDHKVRRLVLKDIEQTLVPMIERSLSAEGALPPEERKRILQALKGARLLPASFDRGDRKPQRQD